MWIKFSGKSQKNKKPKKKVFFILYSITYILLLIFYYLYSITYILYLITIYITSKEIAILIIIVYNNFNYKPEFFKIIVLIFKGFNNYK
jgi:MFS-type transporter involved in bile tolerance (Atg22 family)